MRVEYDPPAHGKDAFNCPNCGVWAHQSWHGMRSTTDRSIIDWETFRASSCQRCQRLALWRGANWESATDSGGSTYHVLTDWGLIYPLMSPVPLPNEDMPESVVHLYTEARNVFVVSERAAAALLRLALERLTVELGDDVGPLHQRIDRLVTSRGLPVIVQQTLDAVRVIGNNAVHAGEIQMEEMPGAALALFGALNFIVERVVTQERQMREMIAGLPESERKKITS